jgi:hypothetical protein
MNYRHKYPTHGFTIKNQGLANVLVMDIAITEVNNPGNVFKTKAIWDTGATGSVITQEVLDHLHILSSGITKVNTTTLIGAPKPTFLVDIFLKPDVRVQAVTVTSGLIAAEHGINCLLGMEIITLGDFSITNFQGNTCMSFRIPSQYEVNFVEKINKEMDFAKRHFDAKRSWQNPCICGSGKKFKNCHGKNFEEV